MLLRLFYRCRGVYCSLVVMKAGACSHNKWPVSRKRGKDNNVRNPLQAQKQWIVQIKSMARAVDK